MISYDLKTLNDIYKDFINNGNPESPIMNFNESTVTRSEFKKKVDLFTAHLIQAGIRQGTFVGYTMPNCPEIFYLFISISRLGACAVPLFHMIPDMGKVDIYKKCNVQFVITTSRQFASLKDCSVKSGARYKIVTIDACQHSDYNFSMPVSPEVRIEDYILKDTDRNLPLLVASSSGTTGIPKTVILTQLNIASEVHASAELVSPVNTDGKEGFSSIMAFPLSTSGILTCIGVLFAGVRIIYLSDTSPVKFVQLLSYWKADTVSAPPAYFEAILSLPMLDTFDLTSVRRVFVGMDFFSPSLLQRLKARFKNISGFGNGYGLVETSNVFMVCKALSEQEIYNPTNVMKLVENIGNSIDIRDENGNSIPAGGEGELYVKGPNVIRGYAGNPEETQRSFNDGWFKTGDIVRNEGNNTITLLGRKKYLIKRGGKSVSPIVVQDRINKIPGVKSSAVVGVPHHLYGEMVWAFIVKEEGSNVELKDIMRHCRNELANYMVPDQVTFIDEIPKNPGAGKVSHKKLKEIANNELLAINGGNNE